MAHRIEIGPAAVTYTDEGCYTRYTDGATFGAHPHDTHHYHVIAHRLGYGDDTLRYCREHEVCHHMVSYWINGHDSQVIWALAHKQPVDLAYAIQEEALTQTFQRWLRANERPIIGDVDWDGLKARALGLLG